METLTIAAIAGPIMALIGIGIFVNKKYYQGMMKDFMKDTSAVYLGGIFAALIGLVIVQQHTASWTLDAAGLVTLFGYAAVIKGALLLALPEQVLGCGQTMAKSENLMTAAGAGSIIIGAYLTYVAYYMVEVAEVVVPAV